MIEAAANDAVIDLTEADWETPMKAYHYHILIEEKLEMVTIIAPSSTVAREGLSEMYPEHKCVFIGVSRHIAIYRG